METYIFQFQHKFGYSTLALYIHSTSNYCLFIINLHCSPVTESEEETSGGDTTVDDDQR